MAHWSGVRSGWNSRGITEADRLRRLNQPDGRFWETRAGQARERLVTLLGNEYPLWAELTWPGETINLKTWKEICETMESALAHQDSLWQELECSCAPNAPVVCRVCRAYADLRAHIEDSAERELNA